ncbi:MAG TPA: arylesterase [Opitutaceae bacterium]|nr:arylesterase [Opitutaceae bacterium]
MNNSTLKTCCAIRSLCCAVLAWAPIYSICLGRYAPRALHSNRSRRFLIFPLSLLLVLTLLFPLGAHAAKSIMVFGDSLSAGYGLAIDKSWVHLLQKELKRTQSGYNVVNASISGETTAGGKQRIAKALKQFKPKVVIVELGANDGLRGTPIKNMEANLDYIIRKSLEAGAKVLLLGMKLPPNYGEPYITQFADVYPRLANRHHILLLPFLLEGVRPDQFQADNLHPVAEAQQHIMLNVMQELKHLLH